MFVLKVIKTRPFCSDLCSKLWQKKYSAGKCPLGKVWILFYCYEYLFYGCDSHSYNLYRLGLRLWVVPVLVLSCCRDEWTSTCSPGPGCLSYSSQTSWGLLRSVWQKVMVVQVKKGRVWAWHWPWVFWDVKLHGRFFFLEENLQPQGHTANLVVFVQNPFNGILLEGAFG